MARRHTLRQRLDALAAELEPRIRDAFLAAVADIASRAELGRIVRALEAGDVEEALRALHIDPAAYRDFEAALTQTYAAGGDAAVQTMPAMAAPDGTRLVIRFDVRNPRAEAFLRDRSSTLVTRIVEDQRVAIRQTLEVGMIDGRNPRNVALDVVGRVNRATGRREGGIVGLTSQQAAFVRNAREELLSGDPGRMAAYFDRERRDRRFDRIVARAIREERPVARADVDRILGRYSDRLLQLRGETIARTEMLQSLNASQREAYEQAIEAGGVQRQNVTKVWRTARDSRVRDTHGMIAGSERAMDERFANGLLYPHEPGAPAAEVINCRCIVEHRIDFLAERLGPPPAPPEPEPSTPLGARRLEPWDYFEYGESRIRGRRFDAETALDVLTPDEIEAIETYQGASFAAINERLRRGGEPTDTIRALDRLTQTWTNPEPVRVYRGINPRGGRVLNVDSPEDLAGAILTDAAYQSVSTTARVSASFADQGGMLLELDMPAGQRGLHMSQAGIDGGQEEIVLPRGTSVEIVSVRRVTGADKEALDARGYDVEWIATGRIRS